MALVTVELRHLLLTDFKLFDFTYPITDSAWKDELEQAIIDYYFFEEIGQETPDRFKHVFATKMKSIMSHYDRLHQLSLLTLDNELNLYKMTETSTDVINKDLQRGGSDNSTSEANGLTTNTEYPQHALITDDIPAGKTANDSTSSSSVEYGSTEALDQTRTLSKVLEGHQGTLPVEVLKRYQSALLRLNGMIIQELKSCFILVY